MLIQIGVAAASANAFGASNATTASSGTMARSSSSRIETIFCPAGVASSPRSVRICMTIAVEVSTKPMPATKATAGESPSSTPTPVSSAPQMADLDDAEPEDLLAQAHSLARLHLEPDDEQEQHHAEFGDVQDRLGIGDQPQAERTDRQPGGEIAQHRAETRRA